MKRTKDSTTAKLAQQIIEQYQPETVEDVQNALKNIFGPIFEAMLNGEMQNHLGYAPNERGEKSENRRNGYTEKTLKTSVGQVPIHVPRDRDGSFEPQIVKKRQRDVSAIEDKVLSMYAKGMSQRDIASTIQDIYGFQLSHEQISNITDSVLEEVRTWQNRVLEPFYPFVFVDCLYVSLRSDSGIRQTAVYSALAYTPSGAKDVLGLWIGETESKHGWMQIFDELKARGIENLGILSMDGVSGLEEGARSIFPDVTVQRCIVHLIRNSMKYIPRKSWGAFAKDLKSVYGAVNVKQARERFAKLEEAWKEYPGALRVWRDNFTHVEQLFNYGSSVRKLMYTTNAIESVNSSFRKVTKQGAFPNEDAVYKLLYLRVKELYKKWMNRTIPGWAIIRNQLLMDERLAALMSKYDKGA